MSIYACQNSSDYIFKTQTLHCMEIIPQFEKIMTEIDNILKLKIFLNHELIIILKKNKSWWGGKLFFTEECKKKF